MQDREKSFLEILRKSGATFGIGDDGVEIDSLKDGFVIANDAFFEDVHFKRKWLDLESIVEKCFLVNLSDIYAMNAIPVFCLLTLSLPRSFSQTQELAQIIGKCARKHRIKIIGGDTLVGEKLHFSLTILGKKNGKLLRRSGIKRGEIVGYLTPKSVLTFCKTQEFGNSIKHLQTALRFHKHTKIQKNTRFAYPILYPKMLLELNKIANAGMDISDGILIDLSRLGAINRVGFKIFKQRGLWLYSPEEYQMLYVLKSRNLKAMQNKALLYRHKFIPFARVVRGKYRFNKKNWHT